MREGMVAGRRLDIEVCRMLFDHDILTEWEHWLPNIPPYSTDPTSAWLVAERLREIGFEVIIGTEGSSWQVELCVSEELYGRGYRGCYSPVGPMPFALSRAAVHAMSDPRRQTEGR